MKIEVYIPGISQKEYDDEVEKIYIEVLIRHYLNLLSR